MFIGTGSPGRQMFLGNILTVGCCAFYLLWWVLASKPTGAVKGFKSGWLLIPASILGLFGVVMIVKGAVGAEGAASFFKPGTVLIAAVVSYVALLAATWLLFHRQVTTELLLIVGWTAIAFLEINALYGLERLPRIGAVSFFIAAGLIAAVSMVCYLLYYGLDERLGYVDGMIPLIMIGIYMGALAVISFRE